MVETQKHILVLLINVATATTAVGGTIAIKRDIFTLTAKRSSLLVMYVRDMETDKIK